MKELVNKATAFILFESPLDAQLIYGQFIEMQKRYKAQLPNWPFAASEKKLALCFWYKQVVPHFLVLLTLSIAALVPLQKNFPTSSCPMFFSTVLTFLILVISYYFPIFYGEYLPKLATIIAEQERIATEKDYIKKCKRTQYSIPALTIIFHTWSKLAGIPIVPVNDNSAILLNQLYGCDKDKLKQNLSRLYKFSAISPKEKAEMQKGIDTARSFFQELQHPPADKILDQLESKLQRS